MVVATFLSEIVRGVNSYLLTSFPPKLSGSMFRVQRRRRPEIRPVKSIKKLNEIRGYIQNFGLSNFQDGVSNKSACIYNFYPNQFTFF
jgi:hypothetical protein